jgi:hypothetical protein
MIDEIRTPGNRIRLLLGKIQPPLVRDQYGKTITPVNLGGECAMKE